MALITCPECGNNISNQAPSCINCGKPIAMTSANPNNRGLFIFLIATIAIFYSLSSITEHSYVDKETPSTVIQKAPQSTARGQSIYKYKNYERSALCSVAYEQQGNTDMAEYVLNKSSEKDKATLYAIGTRSEMKKTHPSERDELATHIIISLDCSAL